MSSTPKKPNSSADKSCGRVLTSSESIALLEAKKKELQDALEAKEQRKRDREEKKIQREEDAKKKAEERELKEAEQESTKAEKEKERLEKAAERKRKAELRLQKEGTKKSTRSCNKENVPSSSSGDGCESSTSSGNPGELSTSTPNGDSGGDQQSYCSVCLGKYEDDVVNGILRREWIRCTNCGLWMHCDCLSTEENSYNVCYMCNVVFK